MAQYIRYPNPSVSSNPSVGTVGSAVPTSATLAAGKDGSGNLADLTITANGLKVDGSGSTQPVSGTVTAKIEDTAGASITVGQKLMATSVPVAIASDQSAIPASQSGTWNINNVSGTVSLPTGASTSALQTTGNTSLSSIDGKLGSLGQKTMAGSAPVVLASDQSALQTKASINTTGSGSAAAATVSTVITLTAPANAVGFILMNLDTSTLNVRWSIGRTATSTLGQQLQPGRDTGFIPCGANVSLCAESGTQNYDIQWVSQ